MKTGGIITEQKGGKSGIRWNGLQCGVRLRDAVKTVKGTDGAACRKSNPQLLNAGLSPRASNGSVGCGPGDAGLSPLVNLIPRLHGLYIISSSRLTHLLVLYASPEDSARCAQTLFYRFVPLAPATLQARAVVETPKPLDELNPADSSH